MTETTAWIAGIVGTIVAIGVAVLGFVLGRMRERQNKDFSDGRAAETMDTIKAALASISVYMDTYAGLQETADDKLHIGNGLYDDLISGDFSDGSVAVKTSLTAGGVSVVTGTPLAGTKGYYVADTSGGSPTRKLTFTDGVLTSET